MLDRVDAVLEHAANAGIERGVRRDLEPVAMGLVYDRVEFLVRELEQIVAAHDLDEIGAAANLFSDGTTHLVRAGRLTATPVRMTAGLDDRLSADKQLRSLEDALRDCSLCEEPSLVHAQVAYGRHSCSERPKHVRGALICRDFRFVL